MLLLLWLGPLGLVSGLGLIFELGLGLGLMREKRG